jgi:hypothetical protein
VVSYWLGKPRDTMHILYFIFLYQKTREKYTTTMNMHPLSCSRRVSDGRKITYFPPRRGCEFNFSKVSRQLTFKTFPPRRGFEFNFSKVSRQDEGSNSTFQKFPAKTRVRIQFFKSFPPRLPSLRLRRSAAGRRPAAPTNMHPPARPCRYT